MTVSVKFLFETDHEHDYVPIVGNPDPALGPTSIASQDAGSSNTGIYYQVGGGGLNGRFAGALGGARQLAGVNRQLVVDYDAEYGAGEWAKWNVRPNPAPPLTSFMIPLRPGIPPIGTAVVGVMYSVGPVLGSAGIVDTTGYADIYRDAMDAITSARASGLALDGLRITMLSTGIYARSVDDPKLLYRTSAASIVTGVVGAVRADPTLADVTVLINTSDRKPVHGEQVGKERYGFGQAVSGVTHAGFDVPVGP